MDPTVSHSHRTYKISRWRIALGIAIFIVLLLITWYVRVHTHHPLWMNL